MEKVESGVFVSVDYTGTLENGDVFDTSNGRQPLEIQVGSGRVLPGFEAALMDMSPNETKTFKLSPEDAYGHRDDTRLHDFRKSEIPAGMEPEVGQVLMLSTPQGQQIPARVDSVDDEKVTFDLNHPLAGQSLTFEVTVVGISKTATQQDCKCGSECSGGGCDCGESGCC